ncbi:MAG TPA: hypothetical protein VKE22_16635 [Haliangiales bacterium]|nr:hypothetical protein [Haliangiales bacterium]
MVRELACALLVCAACGGASASTVPVTGSDVDLSLVAGSWEGSYQGRQSGRSGAINFDLALGHHAAEGKVTMQGAGMPPEGVALRISFVEMEGGQIRGQIVPYTDPQCRCLVDTEFLGRVKGDAMDGTFTTRLPDGRVQGGVWEARRKAH